MDSFLGKTVSLDCGGVGHFQGVIDSVHLDGEQTITLKKAFKDGKPLGMPSVTIRADHIQDLNLLDPDSIKARKEAVGGDGQPLVSTVEVRKKQRPGVAESLRIAKKMAAIKEGSLPPGEPVLPSAKPVATAAAAAAATQRVVSPKKGMAAADRHHNDGGGGFRSTPTSKRQQQHQRDKDCFGSGMDASKMSEEFDFEKNLALFNKRLVFQEIEKNQPDVVRLVDCNLRQKNTGTPAQQQQQQQHHVPEPKYRNDQNVLATIPAQFRQITLSKGASSGGNLEGEYSTDSGLIVPGIAPKFRDRLMLAAEARGISRERMTEMVARSVADLTLQMLGGERRLNPDNRHQVPKVVALCGPGKAGSYGLASLRHLASQGVRTVAYLPTFPMYPPHVDAELNLYKLCLKKHDNVLVHDAAKDLPDHCDADLILLALDDHEMPDQERSQPWHRSAVHWAKTAPRSHSTSVVALDPLTPSVAKPELPIKASVLPGCPPLWYGGGGSQGCKHGKLYMANLALPAKVYKDVGLAYASPFGAKTCIPLNIIQNS